MADSPARFKDLCLDALDHQALADWWLGDTQALLAAGATLVRVRDSDTESDGAIEWDVLADPEGNEFCVFTPE